MLLLDKFKPTDNRLIFLYFLLCRPVQTWAWLDELSNASGILAPFGVFTKGWVWYMLM